MVDNVKQSQETGDVTSPDRPDARAALLAAARAELVEHGVAAIGLRAVARRAGLSHAAPGYFFGDRAGMLTALAAEGFTELAEALERDGAAAAPQALARLGDSYIDYALTNGALFDLMFQRDVVHTEDPLLLAAQKRALTPLLRATGSAPGDEDSLDALMSWALVHGLVTLARQGALPVEGAAVRRTLQDVTARFAAHLR